MKNILLIGLGRFGRHMAQKLHDLKHQVLAIDKDERRVQDAMAYVTNAEIGDASDPALIDALGVAEFDLCVVTMGHDLQASLEITSLLKKRGAPFVLTRVARDAHAQFLLACGADEVIYPEKQMATWAAVRYSSNHIFDYIRLSPEYAIYETDIPDSWIGHTVVDLGVRQRYRLNVLAIRKNGQVMPMPGPAHEFVPDERVILLGSEKDLQKFIRF
ncbi:MAG: TrkA family potassium uptake protein [Eubacteriales bacterium]